MTEDPTPPPAPDATPDVTPEVTPPKVSQRGLWVGIAIGGLLIAVGLWVVTAGLPGLLTRSDVAVPAPPEPAPAVEARRIQVTLFYVSDDGTDLVPENREVLYGATTAEQVRHIVEAQIQAPPDGRASAIPTGTRVRAVFLGAHSDAYVDLSPEIAAGQSGGSLDEALTVFAIVNAVTSNLPDVATVQILVDGKEVDSLAGHLDLRQPLGRAASWIRKGQ